MSTLLYTFGFLAVILFFTLMAMLRSAGRDNDDEDPVPYVDDDATEYQHFFKDLEKKHTN